MVHMGRYTSALLLIATGVALVFDQTSDTQYLRMLLDWWPVIFIVLGAEVIILSLIYHNNDTKLRFSFGSVFGAACITVLVMLLTGFGAGKLDMTNWRFWEHGWKQYERPVERIAVDDRTRTLRIHNTNGKVFLKSGETDQVEIQSVVQYSSFLSEEESRAVEEESTLKIMDGETLEIQTEGKKYRHLFWQSQARMNLTITVPSSRAWDYQIELSNGDVTVHNLTSSGPITVQTRNGDVEMRQVTGTVDVMTSNGDIQMSDMDGSIVLETSNGDISLTGIKSAAEATTSNGDVEVTDADSSIMIRTSNGDVTVRSRAVQGNWKIDTMNGDISMYVPESGDYRIRGIGDIDTDIPWLTEEGRDMVKGQIGNGLHFIDAETRNGDLEIEYNR